MKPAFPMRIALALCTLAAAVGCIRYEGAIPEADQLETPGHALLHPSGRWLYVLNTNFDGTYRVPDGGGVLVIDLDTFEIRPETTVRLGSFGGRLAFAGDDPAAPDTLVVSVRGDRSLVVLDLANDGASVRCGRDPRDGADGLACRILNLPRDPFAVLPLGRDTELDRDYFAVATLNGRVATVTSDRARPSDSRVESIPVLNGAAALVPFPRTSQFLVAGRFSDRIASLTWFLRADGSASPPVLYATTQLAESFNGAEIRDALLSQDGRFLYLASSGPSSIVVLELSVDAGGQGRVTYRTRFDLDGAPSSLTSVVEQGEETLYVALADRGEVVAFAPRTGEMLERIAVGGLPAGVVADVTRHNRLYVPLFDDNAVAVIDLDPASPNFRRLVRRIR